MRKIIFQTIAFVILVISTSYGVALIIESPTDKKTYHFKKPLNIINIFYDAVDRNELTVFDQIVMREMIIPIHVEYIYELSSPIPNIRVYSKFKTPIIIPAQPNCKATAISATISTDGQIMSTTAHITHCD